MRSSSKSRNRNRNANRRGNNNGSVVNRVFESAGPEGKVRGTPQQIIDKYISLAHDSQLSGDRVSAENFQQHAEHYSRILSEAQKDMQEKQSEIINPNLNNFGKSENSFSNTSVESGNESISGDVEKNVNINKSLKDCSPTDKTSRNSNKKSSNSKNQDVISDNKDSDNQTISDY